MAQWKVMSWDKNGSNVIMYDGGTNYQTFAIPLACQTDPQVFLDYCRQQCIAVDQGIVMPATSQPSEVELGAQGSVVPGQGDPTPPWTVSVWDKLNSQVVITNGTIISKFSVPAASYDNLSDFLSYVQIQALAIDQGGTNPATASAAETALVSAVVGQMVQGL